MKRNIYTDKEAGFYSTILRFLMARSKMIHDIIIRKFERSEWWGLSFFVIRDNALELDIIDKICNLVSKKGFEIILIRIFDSEDIERVSKYTRGGNWKGGGPVAGIVAFDPSPKRIIGSERRKYPEVDNVNVLSKIVLREEINALVSEDNVSNFLHATDNLKEAWAYIHVAMPSHINEVKKRFRSKRKKLLLKHVSNN